MPVQVEQKKSKIVARRRHSAAAQSFLTTSYSIFHDLRTAA
jgi:hypothetical protein